MGKTTAVLAFARKYHLGEIAESGSHPDGHERLPVCRVGLTGNTGMKDFNRAMETIPYTTWPRVYCGMAPADAHGRHSSGGWVWYSYIRLEASQTDLDAYAIGLVEGLVDARQALNLEINGR